MRYILDTHIFLWAIAEPERLSKERLLYLENKEHEALISSVTIAELAIKASIGKLSLTFDPIHAAGEAGFDFLDFSPEQALQLKDLPIHHRDPFDRMLIVQAMVGKIPIMSDDACFGSYNVKLL